MLRLHLLGYTYLSQDGVRVPLAGKALALITFLNLEDRPYHREALANLLWNTPNALRNLRVELTHVRKLLPHLIPVGQPLLGLHLSTDLECWLQQANSVSEMNLNAWLSVGSGLPLSGLEDLGTPEFQVWVDEQRWGVLRQIELALSGVCAALERRGLDEAAKLTLERLSQLGLQYQADVPAVPAGVMPFERPALRRSLQGILARARQRPQLLLLRGRSGAGRGEVVAQALAQSDWAARQWQVSPHPGAGRAAFLHQVLTLLTSEPQGEVRMLLTHAPTTLEDTLRAWTLLAASDQPILLIFDGVTSAAPWLLEGWHFAMNLPFALMLVMCSSPLGNEDELQHALGGMDHTRVHVLSVPSLGVQAIMSALHQCQPDLAAEDCRAQATVILQQSHGWAVHARDLLVTGILPGGRRALSLPVRHRLLSDLSELPADLRGALTRLAVPHSPLDDAVGDLLLGHRAQERMAALEGLGLLLRSAEEETVGMPDLRQRSSDLDEKLHLPDEALRVALAGTLTPTARREINGRLARHYRELDPILALYYAGRAGLRELARELQGQFAQPELCERVSRTWEPSAALKFPDGPHAADRQHCTANGYNVVLEGGQLIVTRAALYGRSPLLRLHWPEVQAGAWDMTLRLDAYGDAPEFGALPPCYALGVQSAGAARTAYSTALLSPSTPGLTWGGPLPLGRWIILRGQGSRGPLELSMRAVDLALTIAELHWGGQTLLPVA